MNKLLKKEESALRTPYKMLLFTALVFPCLNILVVGSALLVTHYFGAFYSYTAAGTVLTLLYELLSSLFHIVNYCLMTCTILTLGSVVFKKSGKSALLPALFAFLAGFAEIVCSTVAHRDAQRDGERGHFGQHRRPAKPALSPDPRRADLSAAPSPSLRRRGAGVSFGKKKERGSESDLL